MSVVEVERFAEHVKLLGASKGNGFAMGGEYICWRWSSSRRYDQKSQRRSGEDDGRRVPLAEDTVGYLIRQVEVQGVGSRLCLFRTAGEISFAFRHSVSIHNGMSSCEDEIATEL